MHKLANLVPLTQQRNSAARNFDFTKKKTAYFGGRKGVSSYVMTTQVLNTTEWTPEVVEKRQKSLLDVLEAGWKLKSAPSVCQSKN
ncbi:HNH endonuclease family protein [Halopseudomonas pachastrellae]|nr:HNH endonuclease family protein [Halopseudomonas pachastrellae]